MSDGYFGGFARSMSFRSHGMPNASTFAHCAGVSRMDRCSSFSSGGVGGLPRGRFVGSMAQVYVTQKRLAICALLNHNNYIDNAPGNDMTTNQTFGVMHKTTGLFFAGFNVSGEPTWGPESDAKRYADQSSARGQALLFSAFGVSVQKKPVVFSEVCCAD